MLSKIILLGLGGFIGSNLRYWIGQLMIKPTGKGLTLSTLVVNVVGSFIFGLLIFGLNDAAKLSANTRLFLGVGLLGALTTFSTFSVETVGLLKDSNYYTALWNIFLNLTISLAAAALGLLCSKALT